MPQANLITLSHPRSAAAEAFRSLRTNLLFSSLSDPVKSLVVTSPAPDEGKSTALANLAVTLAEGGHSTIIVDCDLRRPSQHEIWGIAREPGLTNAALESTKTLPLVETDVENLRVLPAGALPGNPADLLGSKRMDAIIAQLAKMADIVLYDAPPVIAVTDAALLGSKLDGALLVLRAGATRRDHAEQARELLERIHVRILGVALTNAPRTSKMDSYYGE
jgi:non-specific protein-tyrosine kinase